MQDMKRFGRGVGFEGRGGLKRHKGAIKKGGERQVDSGGGSKRQGMESRKKGKGEAKEKIIAVGPIKRRRKGADGKKEK